MTVVCWGLFRMLLYRYFFDLLRWTLGRAERTARAGARNSRKPIITQAADCQLPIVDLYSLASKSEIGNWQSTMSCPIVAVRLFEGSESQ